MERTTVIRTAGGLMIGAAVAGNAAFALLASVFAYPDVLRKPVAEILQRFSTNQAPVTAGFLMLAVAAACLIPVAVIVGRMNDDTTLSRLAAVAGVLAGVVQVLGLLRWIYAVPVIAQAATDPDTRPAAIVGFEVLHAYLGVAVGETLGYLATAVWTLLVIAAPARSMRVALPRLSRVAGGLSAVAILAGVLEPAGVPAAGLVNFAGYIIWSLWLTTFGILLIRRAGHVATVDLPLGSRL
jgi:Domain of unknown function (DUF4386)